MKTQNTQDNQRPEYQLGIRANWRQFSLLVLINVFVGAIVGMERSILPAIAEHDFNLMGQTAILTFIVVFGVTKAFTNFFAGSLSDTYGRKPVLVLGWIIAIPVPFLLMWAPTWNWILLANVLLGISQGMTWSTTVIMKIDLAGPSNRGLAMGLNEFAGYFAVAATALATGWIAGNYGLRPQPFYLGVVLVILGFLCSAWMVKETQGHSKYESKLRFQNQSHHQFRTRDIFFLTSWGDRNLSSVSQAGLVNNLNDGMAWGLFPFIFLKAGIGFGGIGVLTAIYPAVWGVCQLYTGYLSDRIGRKNLIISGMWLQAIGILITSISDGFEWFFMSAVILGIGTAMVYPTLLAVIGDVAQPAWRASAVGVYRFWRDLGYAIGALVAGITADLLGVTEALLVVAGITFISGLIVKLRMSETLDMNQ